MAVSKTSICNSALVKVGAERISSITQDTKRAIILNAIYDQVRDSVLRAHRWNFAIKRVALAPTAAVPAFGYNFEYDLPNDCLRLLDTDPDDIDFVIEERKIRTDEPTLDVLYIFQNIDESSWDSCFAEAMAWRLASEISYNLTQSSTVAAFCDKKYKEVLAEARSMDGAEGPLKGIEADTWTGSRRQ
jgi:hypothetical protein